MNINYIGGESMIKNFEKIIQKIKSTLNKKIILSKTYKKNCNMDYIIFGMTLRNCIK